MTWYRMSVNTEGRPQAMDAVDTFRGNTASGGQYYMWVPSSGPDLSGRSGVTEVPRGQVENAFGVTPWINADSIAHFEA